MQKYMIFGPFLLALAVLQLSCFSTSALVGVPERPLDKLSEDELRSDVRKNLTLPKFEKVAKIPAGEGQPRLFFVNEQTGWMWREREVWKTVDAGKSWNSAFKFSENERIRIKDISFINEMKGWLATGTTLLSTSDGGLTWEQVPYFIRSRSFEIRSIAVRGQRLVIGGSIETTSRSNSARSIDGFNKAIFYSADMGATWNVAKLPLGKGSVRKVGFRDDGRLFAIGEISADIFVSYDGTAWTMERLNSPCIESDLQKGNESRPIELSIEGVSNVWISFDDGRIIFNDLSNYWCDRALPSDVWKADDKGLAYFQKLCFVNAHQGWGVKANGQLWETSTGGATWSSVSDNSMYGDIIRVGDKCLFAFDEELYRTTD